MPCRYFVLELLPGGEFFNYLQSAGKLSEDKCRFYSAAVVLALGELHRNKIAYRDLKPENMVRLRPLLISLQWMPCIYPPMMKRACAERR